MAFTGKPKIAILTLHPSNGGGVLSSLRVVYDFCSKYFEPTVFCLSFDPAISAHLRPLSFRSSTRYTVIEGMRCVEIGARWSFWEPWHYTATRASWQRELAGFDYFFVTSGTAIVAHPLVLLKKKFVLWVAALHADDRQARRAHLPIIRRVIEYFSLPRMQKIEQEIFAGATRILPMSSDCRRLLVQVVEPSHSMDICPYPIEPVGGVADHHSHHVIAIGRFDDPRKNVDMLMRAWRQIYARLPDARLTVVGRKPDDEVLQRYISVLATGSVTFTGLVTSAEREKLLSRSALMLITSQQEGLGIIGLEALSHAIPVISTRCGGPLDYVIEGRTGFLVDIDDDRRMAECAVRLLKQPVLSRAMGCEGIKLLEERFSRQHIYDLFRQNMIFAWPELRNALQ